MTPQLPPLPPSEPLDEQERALARALRGLPASLPPPELDARILGASRRAIAIAGKPRSIRPGWVLGLSTAAVAVLAVGMLLKMHMQGRDQAIAPPTQAPAAAESPPSPAINAPPADTFATEPAPAAKAVPRAFPAPPVAIPRVMHSIPPPPEPPVITEQPTEVSTPAPAMAPPAPPAEPIATPSNQAMQAPTPVQSDKAGAAATVRKEAARDRLGLGSGQASSEDRAASEGSGRESALLPSLDDDAQLPPAQWIERIRARVDAADGDGARESLRRFIARYPNAEIPADLAPLRQ
jgi:hypothetical protein